jgi:cell division protein FtsI (penicillin-binding protein 3)
MKLALPDLGLDDVDRWEAQADRTGAGTTAARARIIAMAMLFIFGFMALSARAVQVAIFRPVDDAATAARAEAPLAIERADIVDRNGELLATTLPTWSVFADPRKIWDARETVHALRTVFPDIDADEMEAKLESRSRFVWIKRRLTPAQRQAVWALGQPGLDFIEEPRRLYPQGPLAAHLLGWTGVDGKGASGIEQSLNNRLIAKGGVEPVRLSIDRRVQYVVERELDTLARAQNVKGAVGIMMDVRTGEIVALSSWPTYDANAAGRATDNEKFNRASLSRFEMGSTFKVFTVAVGLDDGVITPSKGYDATRALHIGGSTIRDFHAQNRFLSIQEILSHSSNIGSAKIALDVGAARLREFYQRTGLLEKAPVELNDSASPLLPKTWSDITVATASYGHGIAVSPVALLTAFAAVTNGGEYVTPTLLARTPNEPIESRRAMKPETSAQMVRFLRDVVTEGTGRKAEAEGYEVGGKTGTAEKSGPQGYDSNRRVSSFVGVFPSSEPRYAVLVLLDEPQGTAETHGLATAGWTAAPAVSRIVARTAPLLGLEPVRALALADAPQKAAGTP